MAALAAVAAAPAAATAQLPSTTPPPVAFNCDASALRGTILSGPTLEPVTANHGQAVCQTVTATIGDLLSQLALPVPLVGGAATAQTAAQGTPGQPSQQATATGGVANLVIKSLPSLPIALPTPNLSNLASVLIPLPPALATVLALPPYNFTGPLNLNLIPAVQALLPLQQLPSRDLLNLGTAVANAQATCVGGQPRLAGSSQLAGLSVLGNVLPTDQVVNQVVTLINGTTVNPSTASLSNIALPAPLNALPLALAQQLQSAIKTVLNGLPAIQLPAVPANIQVIPGAQSVSGGTLTQQAAHVLVSILGTSVADLILGEARASDTGVTCTPPSSTTAGGPATANVSAAQLALSCTKRKLTLIDVVPEGNHVRLLGAADHQYIGQQVWILFAHHAAPVAAAIVQPDGSFQTTAPMPPRSIRSTNRARYQAAIGTERSLRLKLMRRMQVTNLSSHDGKVTIDGLVTQPLANPVRTIVLTRRVTCTTERVVGRFKPARNGRFAIIVPAPQGLTAAVYRLQTQVRKSASSPRLFPTFTLPRAVNLIG